MMPRRSKDRRYHVVGDSGGWRVVVNDCMTRPLAERSEAERLARRLQQEANGLARGSLAGESR